VPIAKLLHIVKRLGELAYTYRIYLRVHNMVAEGEDLLKTNRILLENLEQAERSGFLARQGRGDDALWSLTPKGLTLCQ
jgi:hypothetical protein